MRTFNSNLFSILTFIFLTTGCSNKQSFSLTSDGQSFKQSSSRINNKVDILWVVDNSSSMVPSQQNILKNFSAFMTNFVSKGLDFQMAVTTTDAYLAGPQFNNDLSLSKFRDGASFTRQDGSSYDHHSGISLMLPGSSSDLVGTFVMNAFQGDQGSGDERAFSSMKAALDNPQNPLLVRPSSYFAVIILSDEDDFSGARVEGSWSQKQNNENDTDFKKRYVGDHDYSFSGLESVDSYINYLDQKTNSTPDLRHYNVSAVTVTSDDCLQKHQKDGSASSMITKRYMDIVAKTNGTLGSLCDDNFAGTLTTIQERILELSTQFYLQRPPLVASIVVVVNGKSIAMDPQNGWSYDSKANSVVFHGTALPPEGATVSVNFTPTTFK
jgi:hypothetical protein